MPVLVSGHALIIALRMRAHRFDVDALQEPVKLLCSQHEHRFLARPYEAVLLEAFVTYLEMQALGLPQNILSASLTRSTRSADSNFFVSVSAITGLADVSCCASTTRVIAPFLRSGPI